MPANAQSTVRNLLFNSANNITRLDFSTTPPTVIPTGIPDAGGVAEAIAHYENNERFGRYSYQLVGNRSNYLP